MQNGAKINIVSAYATYCCDNVLEVTVRLPCSIFNHFVFQKDVHALEQCLLHQEAQLSQRDRGRFVPSTNTTLVCVLSDVIVKSAAILCICVSICVVSDVSATVALIGVKVCKSIHIGTGHKVSPFGEYPQGIPKIPNFWLKF